MSATAARPAVTTDDAAAAGGPAVFRIPRHVEFRAFPGECLVLNLETGLYHSLNATGGRIFELLANGFGVIAVAERLAAEFSDTADRLMPDLQAYCVELARLGLIVPESAP